MTILDPTPDVKSDPPQQTATEWLRDLSELTGAWLYATDAEGRYTYVSENIRGRDELDVEFSVGARRAEIAKNNGANLDIEPWKSHLKCIEDRKPFSNFHYSRVCRTGAVQTIQISGKPKFDEQRHFLGYVGVVRLATDATRLVSESEKRYRTLFDAAGEAMFVFRERRVVAANQAAAEITGRSAAALIGMMALELVHPGDHAMMNDHHRRRTNGEVVAPYQFRILRPDRSIAWAELHVTNVVWDGAPATISHFFDITKNKAIEAELTKTETKAVESAREAKELRDYLDLALQASEACVWKYDVATDEVHLSSHWNKMLGGNAMATCHSSKTLMDFVDPRDSTMVAAAFDAAVNELANEYSVEHRVRRYDGSWLWIQSRGKIVERAADGKPRLLVGVNQDISDKHKADEMLQQTQKLEAIGRLTGGLAHDFSNLLSIILGSLDELAPVLSEASPDARHQHRAALDAAVRGTAITRSLLATARKQPLEVSVYDINSQMFELMPLLRSSVGKSITLLSQLTAGRLPARIDPGGLNNVILNLVINARDALAAKTEHRQINLRTRRVSVTLAMKNTLPPGGYAVIEVEDNGSGMDAETADKAFEPFFTTKGEGRGTGLGLAMVYGYVTQLGGTARIDSSLGKGCTIEVWLPLVVEDEIADSAAEASRLLALTSLNVLDTEPETEFDEIVAEAAHLCDVPIAAMSLVDAQRQWFKAKVGLEAPETSREMSFCAHVIADPSGMMVVPDVTDDPRFTGNALVRSDPNIRFYAGIALHAPDRQRVGALCVIDTRPRNLNASQLAKLSALAKKVDDLLEVRRVLDSKSPAPTLQPLVDARAGAGNSAVQPATRGRVLVVDDEPELCGLVCRWLGALGYVAVSADSADTALRCLEAEQFDILFTDVVMPGSMNGIDLARAAEAIQPNIKICVTSGNYPPESVDVLNVPSLMLPKPYRKNDLADALTKLAAR